MQLTGPTFLLVALSLATGVHSLCTTPGYTTGICASTVRPYSENEYVWGGACGIPVPPTGPQTLMASNVEFYDPQYGCDDSAGYHLACCAQAVSCAVYENCQGPPTPLPPPDAQFPPPLAEGWSVDMPCAVDNAARVLTNTVVRYDPGNSPYSCTTYCGSLGYAYAGVEYGDECYCGTGYVGGAQPPAAPLDDCDVLCAGGSYWYCGGSWRMQIYKFA
ncbi:WSC domain-containing protein [Phanerochaete sordida]|uniref:WSC domain-containing protein n=1 Tax=Phanerochaete sordida TaxID=48140 RepID=A0A9P3G947_9APHY|nr:WSC domain-containing protein [Phanerochaete sordida]